MAPGLLDVPDDRLVGRHVIAGADGRRHVPVAEHGAAPIAHPDDIGMGRLDDDAARERGVDRRAVGRDHVHAGVERVRGVDAVRREPDAGVAERAANGVRPVEGPHRPAVARRGAAAVAEVRRRVDHHGSGVGAARRAVPWRHIERQGEGEGERCGRGGNESAASCGGRHAPTVGGTSNAALTPRQPRANAGPAAASKSENSGIAPVSGIADRCDYLACTADFLFGSSRAMRQLLQRANSAPLPDPRAARSR